MSSSCSCIQQSKLTWALAASAGFSVAAPAFGISPLTPPHRLHHALDLRQGNSNFALIFPIWDVIFGTLSDPAKERLEEVGVPTVPSPAGFLADLLDPCGHVDTGQRVESFADGSTHPRRVVADSVAWWKNFLK